MSGADSAPSNTEPSKFVRIFFKYRLVDWIVSFLLGLLLFLLGRFVPPYCRPFQFGDESINREYKTDTFPNWSLPLIAIAPLPFYAVGAFIIPVWPREKFLEFVIWCLIQAESVLLGIVFVELPKLYAGRLRPDFLQRLQAAGYNATYPANVDYCSIDNKIVVEGRKSFPSGHSSLSFCAMVPLAIFLSLRLRAVERGEMWRFLIAIIPLILSFIVAISRTRDDRHHFADILAGSVLGVFAAGIAYGVNLHRSPWKVKGEKHAHPSDNCYILNNDEYVDEEANSEVLV